MVVTVRILQIAFRLVDIIIVDGKEMTVVAYAVTHGH